MLIQGMRSRKADYVQDIQDISNSFGDILKEIQTSQSYNFLYL